MKRPTSRAGTATVEFAFVAPAIFFVFLGAIEMTNINFIRNMANDTAYQVARKAIIPGADIDEIVNDSKAFLSITDIHNATVTVNEGTESISVDVDVPISDNSWGLGKFISGMRVIQSCELTKQVKG